MKIENQAMWEDIQDGAGDWEIVDDGHWEQEHKMQFKTSVVKHIPTGNHYQYTDARSGSPFTDWHYESEGGNYPDLEQVERKERTIVEVYWEAVPKAPVRSVAPAEAYAAPYGPAETSGTPWGNRG